MRRPRGGVALFEVGGDVGGEFVDEAGLGGDEGFEAVFSKGFGQAAGLAVDEETAGDTVDAPRGLENGIAVGGTVELGEVEGDLVAEFAVARPRINAEISGVFTAAKVGGEDAGEVFVEVARPFGFVGDFEDVLAALEDEFGAVKIFGDGDRSDAEAYAAAAGGGASG